MKIAVINGNARQGSTWHCMDTLVKELEQYGQTEVTQFYLPKDMPHFCNGCFNCITKGEQTCPHAACVAPIVKAMEEADLIILTSPVYAMDVSGQLKALLDHLCFMWMSHRPNPALFNKVAVTVSTTAGAGLGHAAKTMRNSLKFWGVKRIYSLSSPVAAMRWSEVKPVTQAKIQKTAARMAKSIARSVSRIQKLPNPFFRSFFFKLMTGMMKKNDWNLTDRAHWENHGWLSGTKPF